MILTPGFFFRLHAISFASVYAQENCGRDTCCVCYLQSREGPAHPEANATLHFSPLKLSAPKHWSKSNSPSKTFEPFISFILHLTWEETLMWNCLMIYCDWCLNACMNILCLSPVFYFFLQRGHFEDRRPSTEHRWDAFKQREAC